MNEVAMPLWAILGESDKPIRWLAVIGGATVGAVFIGFLVQLAAKAFFIQQVPRWPMWGVRTLGGGLCGWLVYLWLFGGGGGGIGGKGGLGSGSGDGSTSTNGKQDRPAKEKDKKL